MKLSDKQKENLIQIIENNDSIPEKYQKLLFPTIHKEYELNYSGKIRKEDLLANKDGTYPVPLQIEKTFYNKDSDDNKDWENLLIFGDNLQFLKTIYENKDPLIRDKVKNKVKLIYIDPPFATKSEFKNTDGVKAYNDKKEGTEFIEFLRRRLILAKEILADDGSIMVHVDQKMGHLVQIILDEIFGKNNFVNEIIWSYRTGAGGKKEFNKQHENIYFYQKSNKRTFTQLKEKSYTKAKGRKAGKMNYGGADTEFFEDSQGVYRWSNMRDVWDVSYINSQALERTGYPTQKPEDLLKRVIESTTEPGDLVLDFFGGSGTTMSVAEKLNRRWITCDLGKLSYFTMQKRILKIEGSDDLFSAGKYNKKPRTFTASNLGVYDLKQTLEMDWEKYQEFVSQLFEFERKHMSINGVSFEGSNRNAPVKIFNYQNYEDVAIDEYYLNNLLNSLGNSAPSRIYIVSPATRVNFISDYYEYENTKVFFLKVPYKMIEELHEVPFEALNQPQSKNNINEIEEMKGFQFIYKPEVECWFEKQDDSINLVLNKFSSYTISGGEVNDFSTVSSIFVNYDYNGKFFIMDDVKFLDEIESNAKKHKDTYFRDTKESQQIVWTFDKDKLGDRTVFIFSDTAGNDITIELSKEGL